MHYWTQVLLELAFAKALVVKQTPEQQEPHMCVCEVYTNRIGAQRGDGGE